MIIQEGIELFRKHRKSQAREKTRESYAYLLRNLEALFGETTVDAIPPEDIHQFLLIVTDGRARSSARLRYAQVKAFFNSMIENGKITSNPCNDLMLKKTFRAPRHEDKDVVAREIVDEIIYRCRKTRNRLIMELQARCGLRIGEVLKLRASDVNDRRLLLRKPKSGREQEVAFMPEAIATRLRSFRSPSLNCSREAVLRVTAGNLQNASHALTTTLLSALYILTCSSAVRRFEF